MVPRLYDDTRLASLVKCLCTDFTNLTPFGKRNHASPGTKISHSGHRPKPEVRNQCPDAPAHKDRAEKAGEHDDELEISVLLSPLAPHYLYINEKPEEDGTNVYKYPDRIYFISHLIISCSKKHKP